MGLEPGAAIAEHLRLVRLLGKGAMGSVWVADHLTIGTQVAVKFMSPASLENQTSVARFAQEAKAAAQIKSPHVVQIFDHGVTTDGLPYIVMELLDGEDLGARIRRLGPLDLDEVARTVGQICKALAKAHQQGIVHRDIKPENVFLIDPDGDRFVKVLDFGVAKLTDAVDMTSTGAMLGTPIYMSPEQLLSAKHVDYRSDLWAVGVVAYRALTGVPPFQGETIGGLCLAIDKGTFPAPSELRPDIPQGVDAWCSRALHRDIAKRFQSAREMAEQIEHAVGLPTMMSTSPREISRRSIAPGLVLPPSLVTSESDGPASGPAAAPAAPPPAAPPVPAGTAEAATFSGTAISPADSTVHAAGRRGRGRAVAITVAAAVVVLGIGAAIATLKAGSGTGTSAGSAAASAVAAPRVAAGAPEPAPASAAGWVPPSAAPATPPTGAASASVSAAPVATARPGPAPRPWPKPSASTPADNRLRRAEETLGL
ncbi:MAG: serine/threonine protein kinase [Deltaproteobacteria bacterium]|nr:serine/threonine protein kinase [Deltaproteobacteria bacterium]